MDTKTNTVGEIVTDPIMYKRQFISSIIMLGWSKHKVFSDTWINPKYTNVFVEINPKTSTAYLYYGAKYGVNSFRNIFNEIISLVPDDRYSIKASHK